MEYCIYRTIDKNVQRPMESSEVCAKIKSNPENLTHNLTEAGFTQATPNSQVQIVQQNY